MRYNGPEIAEVRPAFYSNAKKERGARSRTNRRIAAILMLAAVRASGKEFVSFRGRWTAVSKDRELRHEMKGFTAFTPI